LFKKTARKPKASEPAEEPAHTETLLDTEPKTSAGLGAGIGLSFERTPPAVEAAADSETISKKRPFWAKGKKEPKKDPSTPEKPPKAGKGTSPKLNKKRKESDFALILTDLGGDRELFWQVTKDNIRRLESPEQRDVLSFSPKDVRFATEGTLSRSKAENMALIDAGEPVQIVNRSKDLRAFYSTTAERVQTIDFRLAPGEQALDALVLERKLKGKSLITGFVLKGAEDSVAILYYLNPEGEMGKPVIAVNPDNIEFMLSQFAASNRLSEGEAQIELFDNAALLSFAGNIDLYPNESSMLGMPLRVFYWRLALLGLLAAAGTAGFAGQQYLALTKTEKAIKASENGIKLLEKQDVQRLENSSHQLARLMSTDTEVLFTLSRSFWQPSTLVSAEAKDDLYTFKVRAKLSKTLTRGRGSSAAALPAPEEIDYLFSRDLPEGCIRKSINYTSTFNEVEVLLECQIGTAPLSRYRGN
jgi:hypothetical protein